MALIGGNLIYNLIAAVITISTGVIIYLKWNLKYWNRIGLDTLNPMLLFGDAKDIFLGHTYSGEQFQEFYRTFKAKGLKHGGVYIGRTPFYIPTDPEICKHILQKDFHHFMNHDTYIDEETDVLSGGLFNQRNEKWKKLRMIMTSAFTSSKMKKMFETLTECAGNLKNGIETSAKIPEPVNVGQIINYFTVEVNGSIAFGVPNSSLKVPNNLFLKYDWEAFRALNWIERMGYALQFILPECILKTMRYRLFRPDVENFFIKTVHDVLEFREQNNVYKEDFVQQLIKLRNSVSNNSKIVERTNLTTNDIVNLAASFFFGGSGTSSITTTLALYQVAINPHVQEALRAELTTVLTKHDNILTYEGVMEMTYMDQVLFETLRKHPVAPLIGRRCTKDYNIPNTNIHLKVGDCVGISTLGLHNDDEYFPEPEVFDPERFSIENINSRPDFTFLPFGKGPRQCVASRFGMLQSKVALCTILKDYKIKLNKKTEQPLVLDKKCFFIFGLESEVWLDLEKV